MNYEFPLKGDTKTYCVLNFTCWPYCFYKISEGNTKLIQGVEGNNTTKTIIRHTSAPTSTLLTRLGRLCGVASGTSVPKITETVYNTDIKDESALKHVISKFFEWTGGEVDHFETLTADDFYEICEEENSVHRISSIFAGRPIKTKMLTQRLRHNDFNSPLNSFMREYVDFKMYTADDRLNRANGYPSKAMTITPKLLNCEFLVFYNLLLNVDVLQDEYKGWGLVVNLPDPKLGFDFYLQNFQKWYSGEEAKLKYLMLACDFSPEEWSRLCSLGEEEENKPLGSSFGIVHTFKEFKITRNDGEICHIGVMYKNKLYFYLGETTEGILCFNHGSGFVPFESYIFMREYVDFKMYTADDRLNRANGYPSEAMTITPKLLSCEFLIFHNLLENAEVLRDEYKGWGLVVHLPDPKLGFDFYLQNFQRWYAGEAGKLKYLMLACDFSPDQWSELCSLGEEENKPLGSSSEGSVYTFKEFKITRNDGEMCHIGVMDEKKLYFYLGETTQGILNFTYYTTLP